MSDYPLDVNGPLLFEKRTSVRELVPVLGGMRVLLYLLVTSRDAPSQSVALRLIHRALRWNSVNVRDFQACNGYHIISRAMRKAWWNLDKACLGTWCSLARIL